jgi:chitodextrinase
MMRAHLICLSFAWTLAPVLAVDEAAARRYALERLVVRDLRPPAAALQAELERDVLRYVDLAERHGRPGPAYFEIGVTGSYMLWGNPGETAYVMAEALPYLSAAAQARVRTFLAAMLRAADPTEVAFEHCGGWGACELRPPRREFYLLPMPPDREPLRPNIWPPPAVPAETLYMLWRYAHATGDWDFIASTRPPSGPRWQRLRNLFQAIPATPSRYGEVAGAIGWLRLLQQFGLTSDPTYSSALAKIRAGLAAGNPFSRFLDAANQRFIGPHHHDWSFPPFHWHRDQNAIGIFFAPEIGRFLADYSLADVRRRVTFNPREGQPGEPNAIEAHWPEWFLYRGEYPPTKKWTGHYGENHMVTPDVPWALFMIHGYVYNEPGETLTRYLDVPYAIGDLCHWQRLVATIQAYGTKEWRPLSGDGPPPNQPPVVTLTSPSHGASFTAPASVDLVATASDPDGSIARVEFLVDGRVVASSTAAPYAHRTTFEAPGSYQLAARATDNQGATSTSPAVTISVQAPPADTTPPTVPQGLSATAVSPNSVRLSWRPSTDDVGVAGYEVERNGSVLSGLVTSTEFTDTGLSAATTYTYRVRATDAAGNRSAWSAPATVTTPASGGGGGDPPPQVTNLLTNGSFETGNFQGWNNEWGFQVSAAAAHTGRFGAKMAGEGRLTQVFRTSRGRRYYVMARVRIDRELARPSWGGVRVQITSYDWKELAVQTLTLQNAPAGEWKRVDLSFVASSNQSRIAFENFSGGGRWEASGDEFYVAEKPIPPDGTPAKNQPPTVTLTAPANGATFTAPATVNMSATASDPDGNVARVEFLINGSPASVVTVAPYTYRATLSAPGAYELAARAIDNLGASATSPTVNIRVQAADTQPPSTPQGLTAAAQSASSIRLRWQPSTDDVGVAYYELERNGAILPARPSVTEFLDSGLAPSTAYTYRVRASDAAGNRSSWSAPAVATTPSAGAGSSPTPNLLVNGGLESGDFQGWQHDYGFSVSASAAHTGRFGLKMLGEGSISQIVRLVPGRRYYVTARVRIDRELARASWGGLRLQITSWDWNELAAQFLTPSDSPIGAWKRVDLAFTATTAETRLTFSNFSGGGRYEASADEFYLGENPLAPDLTPPANQPPQVALTAPADGASLVAPASVELVAAASDPDGSVVRVEFLVNGAVNGSVTTAPYVYRVTLPAGNYTLAARAFDNQGASMLSAAVTITVRPPAGGGDGAPSVNLLSNGDFESGNLNGWSGIGQPTQADRRSGQWSVLLTNGSISQVVNTTPGQRYKLTGWARIAGQSGADWGGFRFEVQSYDWTTLAHSGFITLESAGQNWVKYALSFTPTTPQTRIQVGFFGGSALRMSVYADDLAVHAVTGDGLAPAVTPVLEVYQEGGQPMLRYRMEGDDPDGAVVRVNWDFGDGGRSQWPSGTRRVGLRGSFTAVFRAADDDGHLVTRTLNWSVPAPPDQPSITITEPAEAATVSSPQLTVRGRAGGAVAEILLSTDRDTMAQALGSSDWSGTLTLRPGWNRILAQVRDLHGRVATAERRVRYVPSTPLAIVDIAEHGLRERWEPLEIRFRIMGSAATHPQMPYDPNPPRGLEFLDGISVEALFSRDNWNTVLRRPAFVQQRYERVLKSGQEWMYPVGEPFWTVRFAPPEPGPWQYRIEVREARGTAQSEARSFVAAPPSNPYNRGPVRVSPTDWRYFEFADGTPFLGGGSGIGAHTHSFSFDLIEKLNQVGPGNQQMFRWWISGQIWGSAWYAWTSRTLPYEGTVPATGLSLESAWADGLASLLLDSRNPLMFQGFSASHPGLIPGRRYRVRVRWRTEGVAGPQRAGQPYGVCLKFTGWPEPGQTGNLPVLVPHVAGDTPWHLAYADFTATSDYLPNLAVILENTTAGRAFVDEVALHELLPDGSLGPQLLLTPRFNAHLTFDLRRSASVDAVLEEAARLGITLRLVVSEKQEFLLNHLGPDGLADRNPGNFNNGPGTPNRWLHEAWWRYLFARFGAYRSIHSWELVNEEAPGPTPHFRLAARLAELAGRDGNPHPATTSTWATFAEEAWKAPFSAPISNVDFHVYVRAGWIEPREDLANDSARFFAEYDRASLAMQWGKPATWGEQGINAPGDTDAEDPGLRKDRQGIWLHKMIWARCGPGGVYPLYWYTDNIFDYRLHHLYGNWNRFMAGIPLNNGRYVDAAARVSHSELRVFGQKDVVAGRAHLWIDNRRHTWRSVVDGVAIPPVSGTVTVNLGAPGARYRAIWFDTYSGTAIRSESVVSDGAGDVALSVQNLSTDTAVRLERQ